MSVEDFGIRLKKSRENKNLNQAELARKAGISRTMISTYEAGKTYPKVEGLKNLLNILEVSSDYLLGIDPQYTNMDDFDLTDSQLQEIERLKEEFRKANRAMPME